MGIALFLEFLARTIAYKAKHPPSRPLSLDPRYKVDSIHATSLDGNLLGTPVERNVHVYLPPGYFESGEQRYPVIYFLHGYGGSDTSTTIASCKDWYGGVQMILETTPKQLLARLAPDRLVASYEQIDALIVGGKLPPFILVQVDGSLHVPQRHKPKEGCGKLATKGCFYVNSKAGNFGDYVVKDILGHIDKTYRTIPDKQHRGIFGHSMGGYGTMSLCMHYPDMFGTAGALASGIMHMDENALGVVPVAPMNAMIAGKSLATRDARNMYQDILDTVHLLFLRDCDVPLDGRGNMARITEEMKSTWDQYHVISLLKSKAKVFKDIHLYLYCDANDEFGFGNTTREIHEILQAAGIDHVCELPADPDAALAPHSAGGVQHYGAALQHLCKHFTRKGM